MPRHNYLKEKEVAQQKTTRWQEWPRLARDAHDAPAARPLAGREPGPGGAWRGGSGRARRRGLSST